MKRGTPEEVSLKIKIEILQEQKKDPKNAKLQRSVLNDRIKKLKVELTRLKALPPPLPPTPKPAPEVINISDDEHGDDPLAIAGAIEQPGVSPAINPPLVVEQGPIAVGAPDERRGIVVEGGNIAGLSPPILDVDLGAIIGAFGGNDNNEYEEAWRSFRNMEPEEEMVSPPSQGLSRPTSTMVIASGSRGSSEELVSSTTNSPKVAMAGNSAQVSLVPQSRKERVEQNKQLLMAFLETKPYEDLEKLKKLGKAAGLRRDVTIIPFDPVNLGYYIIRADGKHCSLAADLRRTWNWSESDGQKLHTALHGGSPQQLEASRLWKEKRRSEIVPLDIIYLADVFQPSQSAIPQWSTILQHPDTSHNIYPGKYTSPYRKITMRMQHFSPNTDLHSKIKDKLAELGDSSLCLEVTAIVCEDGHVSEQGEGFLMAYADLVNAARFPGHQPFMTTVAATPSTKMRQKALEAVDEGKELYEIVPDDQPEHPLPYPHLATLEEVTTLPYKIHESRIKERWISGTRPFDNDWGDSV